MLLKLVVAIYQHVVPLFVLFDLFSCFSMVYAVMKRALIFHTEQSRYYLLSN